MKFKPQPYPLWCYANNPDGERTSLVLGWVDSVDRPMAFLADGTLVMPDELNATCGFGITPAAAKTGRYTTKYTG